MIQTSLVHGNGWFHSHGFIHMVSVFPSQIFPPNLRCSGATRGAPRVARHLGSVAPAARCNEADGHLQGEENGVDPRHPEQPMVAKDSTPYIG